MLTSSPTRSGIRWILIGVVALAALAAVCVAPWRGNQSLSAKSYGREDRKIMVGSSGKPRSARDICMDRLDKTLQAVNPSDWRAFLSKVGVVRDGVLGYVDEKGQSKITQLSPDALHRSLTVSASALKSTLSKKHKFVDVGAMRILVYADNTVITADTHECAVSGVYLGRDNQVHPNVAKSMGKSLQMTQDKKKLCRTKYGRCSRDGAVCAVKARENCGRVSCSTSLPCPGGWSKYGNYFSCEGDGCTAECNSMNCGNVGQYGKCTVDSTNCDFSHLDKKISDTSTVVGNVVDAIQTGLSLTNLLPPPFDTAFGFVSEAVGFANNAGMTAEQAYNKMMQDLSNAITQMQTCVDEKIMQTNVFDVQTSIRTIQTRLDVNGLKLGTPAGRVDRIYKPNEADCTRIGAQFQVIADSSSSQVKVDTMFPYALKALEVCSLNYLGCIVDEKKGNFPPSNFQLVQAIYKRMASDVSSAVGKMINWLNMYHSSNKQCGFFNSDKRKLSSYISNLRVEYLEPINKLRANITAGKQVTLTRQHRQNSVVQTMNRQVRGGDKLSESKITMDAMSCLQACMDSVTSCVAADALPRREDDGSVSTLCRLYSQKMRAQLKLVLESRHGAAHFDLARS